MVQTLRNSRWCLLFKRKMVRTPYALDEQRFMQERLTEYVLQRFFVSRPGSQPAMMSASRSACCEPRTIRFRL